MESAAPTSIEHAEAMAKLTSELAQRSARIDALSSALEIKCEEHEMLRGNCALMQEQLSQLRAVVMQRLEGEHKKVTVLPIAATAPPPPPPKPPPVDVPVDIADEEEEDDDENGVYVLPDGSLSTVPPPEAAPAGAQPPPTAAAPPSMRVPDALRQPLRAIDEALARARTAKGEMDARLEEAMTQGIGKELAAWGRNGREALERLRPSKRSE